MAITFQKRQKEMKRREKQQMKEERRAQKKAEKRAKEEAERDGITIVPEAEDGISHPEDAVSPTES